MGTQTIRGYRWGLRATWAHGPSSRLAWVSVHVRTRFFRESALFLFLVCRIITKSVYLSVGRALYFQDANLGPPEPQSGGGQKPGDTGQGHAARLDGRHCFQCTEENSCHTPRAHLVKPIECLGPKKTFCDGNLFRCKDYFYEPEDADTTISHAQETLIPEVHVPVLTISDLYFLTSTNERKCPLPPDHGTTHYSSHSRPRGPGQEMVDCQRRTENAAPGGPRPSSWPCCAPLPQRGSGELEAPAAHSFIHVRGDMSDPWSDPGVDPPEVSSFSSLCFLEEAFPSPHYGGQSLEKWQLGFHLLTSPPS